MTLITGGTGFIGSELCKKLAEQGEEFVLLSRHPEKAKRIIPQAKRVFSWEPLSNEPSLAAFQGVSCVVNLAGETVGQRWNETVKQRIYESRILGTRNLLSAMKKVNPKPSVLINASAIGYYGDGGEKEITEDSPCGSHFLAKLCADWEAEAKKAEEFGIRVVLLRIGIVLGLGGGALAQMLFPFKLGLGGPIGNGKQWFSWIHMEDVVGLILHAIKNSALHGAVNACAPEPVRNKEFSSALGKVLHRPAFLPVPSFALKLLFGEFASCGLLASQKVLPKKALDFGYSFQFPTLVPALDQIFH